MHHTITEEEPPLSNGLGSYLRIVALPRLGLDQSKTREESEEFWELSDLELVAPFVSAALEVESGVVHLYHCHLDWSEIIPAHKESVGLIS